MIIMLQVSVVPEHAGFAPQVQVPAVHVLEFPLQGETIPHLQTPPVPEEML